MVSKHSREKSFVTMLCGLLSLQNCRNAEVSPMGAANSVTSIEFMPKIVYKTNQLGIGSLLWGFTFDIFFSLISLKLTLSEVSMINPTNFLGETQTHVEALTVFFFPRNIYTTFGIIRIRVKPNFCYFVKFLH